MNTMKQETHRPGVFKQSNKQHKTGRHRSKSAIYNEMKGKQNIIKTSKKMKRELGREARRHQLSQIRKMKREEVLSQKRNLGTSAPVLICVIPLQEDIDIQDITSNIEDMAKTDMATIATSQRGVTHINVPRLKQRFSIIIPPTHNILATLDAAKVANTILFVTSVTNEANNTKKEIIDDWGKEVIVSCLAQGLPATIFAVCNIQKLHIKKRQEYKQSVQRAISKWFPEEKIFEFNTITDCFNILRHAGSQKQRSVFYKNKRSYFLAEKLSFEHDIDSSEFGTVSVTGYLRGSSLSVNSLVHVQGLGVFQMSQISAPLNPYSLMKSSVERRNNDNEIEMSSFEHVILQVANPKEQESLESINIPDPMDAEQTWPTEEELAEAEAKAKKKIVKLVPKGTSEYQAAWIPDEDAESVSENSESEFEDNMSVEEARSIDNDSNKDSEDDEEYVSFTVSELGLNEERYDKDIDMLEEEQTMKKLKEAKLDAQFPDEVDTPQDMLAKMRFQKYRGLESFRTSLWDPKENLPSDYSRIFQFENFERTRKRIYKENDESRTPPGSYITIKIARVGSEIFKTFSRFSCIENQPVIVTALLPHENKISLLNIVLKHSNTYTQPIKSKEKLIFQCGFRRFAACPIFSQHTTGTKHKHERYFHPQSTIVASMFAPITFPPCPVLCYIENKDGHLEMVATGSVLSCNPDRIVVKRAVLSGHPYKVHKKSAVIRFMFYNREDIEWFKPIELRTKYGRRGHIKEPLGTHGHMKCVFNGQLKSQDTILMNLYKRVFPKWTYEPLLLTEPLCQPEREKEMNVE